MKVFAIKDTGMCGASKDMNGYKKYGKAGNCKNGVGAPWVNDVYRILHPILHGGMNFKFFPF